MKNSFENSSEPIFTDQDLERAKNEFEEAEKEWNDLMNSSESRFFKEDGTEVNLTKENGIPNPKFAEAAKKLDTNKKYYEMISDILSKKE